MIKTPFIRPPYVLQNLFEEFRPMFVHTKYRQFCRYITSSWVSPTRSVAYLNGISVEHSNQTNLNRFLRNVNTPDMFLKSAELSTGTARIRFSFSMTQLSRGAENTSMAQDGFMIKPRVILPRACP